MLLKCDFELNREEIYSHLIKITKRRGVIDLWGVYFFNVKDDFQIFLDLWKGIRFIRDIVAYWDNTMILTLIDKFPIITVKEILQYCLKRRNNSYEVQNSLYEKLLEKYNIILLLIKDRGIEKIIFPITTRKGIIIASIQNNLITKVKVEEELENIIRPPKECPISVNILDVWDKIFFAKQDNKVKLILCTTNRNNLIERMIFIPMNGLKKQNILT